MTMSIVAPEYLRRYVRGRSTVGMRPRVLLELLGKPEIHEFEMTPFRHGNDDVFRLKIAVDNIMLMQIL